MTFEIATLGGDIQLKVIVSCAFFNMAIDFYVLCTHLQRQNIALEHNKNKQINKTLKQKKTSCQQNWPSITLQCLL